MWHGASLHSSMSGFGILFICVNILIFIAHCDACPTGCFCTIAKLRDGSRNGRVDMPRSGGREKGSTPKVGSSGRKVSCPENLSIITSVSQISSLPLDTVILDLSKNAITVLENRGFNRVSSLQKLDLSYNKISIIEGGAFIGLKQLVKLNLSHNKIGSITNAMFEGLPKLEKLYFSNNKINTIPEGTFNSLHSLKKIDFQSDYLRCDCHLQWIVKWTRDKNVKIRQSTTCGVPRELKGKALRSLKKKDLHCERPLELPLFEISPKKSQVVFEGDKIPLVCRASVIDVKTRMVWLRKGDIVETNRSIGIYVHTVHDQSFMIHTLVLDNLMESDTGIWQCMVTTPQGNVSSNINIVVLSNSAATCSSITSKTKKGIYKWPRTVAGVVSEQPCKRGKGMKASHKCTQQRTWEELNVGQCEYIDELTRKLQELALVGDNKKPVNGSLISKIAKDLKVIVDNPSSMSDLTHFMLASKAVETISSHIPHKNEISSSVVAIVSSLMNVDSSLFQNGQLQDKSCTRLINVVENIPRHIKGLSTYTEYTENIVIEAKEQDINSFAGMTCMAYSQIFSCQDRVINQTTVQENLFGTVQLPKTLFNNTAELKKNSSVSLQFILYKDPKLFPVLSLSHDDPVIDSKTVSVVSSVLSVSTSSAVTNLTDPITLTFKVKATSGNLVAAYWDINANGGLGDWRTDGCKIHAVINNYTIVHCHHLSIFAVLETFAQPKEQAIKMFKLMQAAVYVGSCVCLLCLMAVIITYVSCFRFINVPKKMKHSVINISVCVLLLIIGFTMGVKRTDHKLACQIVGISLHYLTLCAIFWITITSYNMLKKFSKADKPAAPPPDLPGMPLPPKPIIRFYLLGWGVPTIICGITAAVSLNHYSEPDYCFLAWDPSLGAFYGPVAFLVIFNLVLFLRISCVIRGGTNNLNESNHTDDVNDIELTHNLDDTNTEIQALTQSSRNAEHSVGDESETQSLVSSTTDQEKRPRSQLYSLITILFLFIVFWVCGAFAVAEPFKSIIPMQEIIFSYLYGFTCAIFGIFMLSYFCLSRKDSCSSWRRFFLCEKQPLYDMNYQAANHNALSNGHVIHANGSVNPDIKSYNITQELSVDGTKQSNINLVPANSNSIIEDSLNGAVENDFKQQFYNPKQNGVAKKFWEKQRQNSRFITRDMAKEFNGSMTSFSGSDVNRQQNYGDLSDGKSHLSIEIQIQPKNLSNHYSQNTRSPLPQQFPLEQNGVPRQHTPVFSMIPTSGSVNPTSPCCSTVSYCDSHANSQQPRSPSSCSLGSRTHPSAFTPVPQRNNTLPKQHKNSTSSNPNSPPPYNECLKRNGSAPRMRDFDGQSQINDLRCQSPRDANSSVHSEPHHMYPIPGPLMTQPGCTYTQYGSVDDHITNDPQTFHRARSHSGGYSSDASAKNRRKRENNFIQEVQQRIPNSDPHMTSQCRSPIHYVQLNQSQNSNLLSPNIEKGNQVCQSKFSAPDSDSGINYKRHRAMESDHNSEPNSSHQRKKPRSHEAHRNSRHSKGTQKQRFDWNKSKSVPYAYVNHNYAEKVKQKLHSQSSMEAKNYWGSPSMEDDSSSSSGDEECFDHNVWVLQNQRKMKQKKETSV